jgi:hypothetical protein
MEEIPIGEVLEGTFFLKEELSEKIPVEEIWEHHMTLWASPVLRKQSYHLWPWEHHMWLVPLEVKWMPTK